MIVALMVVAGCLFVVVGLGLAFGVWLALLAIGVSLLAGAWLVELKLRELARSTQREA